MWQQMQSGMQHIGRFALGLIPSLALSLLIWLGWSGQSAALAAETGLAIIRGTSESADVTGTVNFTETEAGLMIEANIDDASPGSHGFHIHEFGSCDQAGSAAGGHFNPDGVKHGLLLQDGFEQAHAGDLGNIFVEWGGATYSETIPGLSLSHGNYAVAGRAVIVHEQEDDFGQPTGNAGGRIGCGTIVIVSPEG